MRPRVPYSVILKALSCAALILAGTIVDSWSAVTPFSYNGSAFFTFDSAPDATNGWSTRSVPGGDAVLSSIQVADAAVQTNIAADIVTPLATDTNPQTPEGSGSTSGMFRWNSPRHFLESRPVGNAYAELLFTLRNDSGVDQTLIELGYDFGIDVLPEMTPAENPGLYGYRVYYSLTGQTGSWVHIPEFDTPNGGGADSLWAAIQFSEPWMSGANLYFLWLDPNGIPGSTGTSGSVEGPYTIDNVYVSHADHFAPLFDHAIGNDVPVQPHDIVVQQCRRTNFFARAVGIGPISYQWYRGAGLVVPNATSSTLTFTQTQPSDSDTYYVVATGPAGTAESAHVTLNVYPDVERPQIVSALARLDGTNVEVVFSEPMAGLSIDPAAFHLHSLSGREDTDAVTMTMSASGLKLNLTWNSARIPDEDYVLIVDPTSTDICQNPLDGELNGNGQVIFPLTYEFVVMPFEQTRWKYNHEGQDLGTGWFQRDFDDSSWSNGLAVFDAKTPPRSIVGGKNVATTLPLYAGSCVTNDIPVYYFRTSFRLPVGLSHVLSLSLRTLIDDFDVAYLNGNAIPIHVRNGLLIDPVSYDYSGGTPVGEAVVEGPFAIPVSGLVEGENLIAVKVFQQVRASSDITFAYELTAVVDSVELAARSLHLNHDGENLRISWGNPAAHLYEADAIDAPAEAWREIGSGGSVTITPGAAQKFYLLRQ